MPKQDFMKYWRVIRYWAKVKYNVSTPDIEMMFFLYSEDIFSKKKFEEFERVMSWDTKRFDRLVKEEWIVVWRKRKGRQATLYRS